MRLNEVVDMPDPEEMMELLRTSLYRDCPDIMEQYNNTKKRLYRGAWKKPTPSYRGRVRSDRIPTDTPQHLVYAADEVFEQKFGIPLRTESLFATTNEQTAESYGRVYVICPIGKYRIFSSNRVEDFYHDIAELALEKTDDRHTQEEFMIHLIEESNYQEFKDISHLTEYGHEVMIACDYYYAVTPALFEKLL